MKIYIGADHRGFLLKEQMKQWLMNAGHEVVDCGNRVYDKDDDFPDFSFAVAHAVVKDPQGRGVVICGSAGGVTIAANKVAGIRCVMAVSQEDVVHNRQHDDVNVLAIASDFTPRAKTKTLITTFLETPYLGEPRHKRRLKKITAYERKTI